jgi:competence protein ComGC
VTLIELLIVIAIIALIAAVSIGSLMLIPEHARARGTEALIAKINSKLVQRLDQFNARRTSIQSLTSCDLVLANQEPNLAHLIAMVRTMRQEFPESFDRTRDLVDNDFDGSTDEADEIIAGDWSPVDTNGTGSPEQSAAELPSRAVAHLAHMQRVYNDNTLRPSQSSFQSAHRPETASAECLFMIVTANGSDTEEFVPGETADTDEDGLPEFVDKWGNPIQFFLWPTHYRSPRQKPGSETNPDDPNQLLTEAAGSSWWTAQSAFRSRFEQLFFSLTNSAGSGPQAYRTYPLIVSAGPDQGFGLVEVSTGVFDNRAIRITTPSQDGYGMDADNIDNHGLQVR